MKKYLSVCACFGLISMCFGTIIPTAESIQFADVIDTEYTNSYQANGSFSTIFTPTKLPYTQNPEYQPTSWGKLWLSNNSAYSIRSAWYGTTEILGDWYSLYHEYTYDNSTSKVGYTFNNYISPWYKITNDSHFAIYQRYAEAPHAYSGTTKEWNLTLRYTIFKDEPYVRLDYWIKNLNESSIIKSQSLSWRNVQADYSVFNWLFLNTSGIQIFEKTSSNYAVGFVSQTAYVYGPSASITNSYAANMKNDTTRYFHSQSYLAFGSSMTDVKNKLTRLNGVWYHADLDEYSEYNLLVANNTDRYDVVEFSSETNYSFYPSSTNEKIYANGVKSNIYLSENPVSNFDMGKINVQLDDISAADGADMSNWNWYFNTTLKYEFPATIPPTWDYHSTNTVMDSQWLENISQRLYGVLYDIESTHGWNHTNLQNYNTLAYSMLMMNLSMDEWATVSDYPLIYHGLAFGRWGDYTWEAMARSGISAVGSDLRTNLPITYEYENNTVEILPYNTYDGYPLNGVFTNTEFITLAKGIDRYVSHSSDSFTLAGDKTLFESFMSWVQNQTNIKSFTIPQMLDLEKNHISYYSVNSVETLDMSNAWASQKIYFNAGSYGVPVYMNNNGQISTMGFNETSGWLYAQRGCIYSKIGEISVSDLSHAYDYININITDQHNFEIYNAEGIEYTFTYLFPTYTDYGVFIIYQDGTSIGTFAYPDLSFTNTGNAEYEIQWINNAYIDSFSHLAIFIIFIGILATILIAIIGTKFGWFGSD